MSTTTTSSRRALDNPHGLEQAVRRELAQQFRLDRVLATGHRSIVYAGRESESGRSVALRALARRPLQAAGIESELRRAMAAAVLDHPHVVPIYRFGSTASLVWYSMKLIEGRSLAAVLRERGTLELDACLRIVEQVASALAYAHRRGVVHGDVRPANILLDDQDWALVTDFVIGRVLDAGPSGSDETDGAVVAFVAPEVTGSRMPTPASDQYALAATIYRCLTGRAPYDRRTSEDAPEELKRVPPRLSDVRPELPTCVSDAVGRALSPRPELRYTTVLDFVAALNAVGGPARVPLPRTSHPGAASQRLLFVDNPRRRTRRRELAVAAGLCVGAAVLAWSLGGDADETQLRGEAPGWRSPPPRAAITPPSRPSPTSPRVTAEPVTADEPPVTTTPRRNGSAWQPGPAAEFRPVDQNRRADEPRPADAPIASHRPPPANAETRLASLYVSSFPWGEVYLDGRYIGNTPLLDIPMTPGSHHVRIVRAGFQPLHRELYAAPGDEIRLVKLILEARP